MFPTITVEQALQRQDAIFIDTRTPKEFQEDHLPNAINNPILDNDERAVVGTLYKQVSRDKAIEQGVEFFSAKLPNFMIIINQHKQKPIIIYCWRGGMRSRAVVALLHSLGYNVTQLEGGYKSYRAYVRQQLEQFQLKPKLIVLWGLTCTGKTRLLSHFKNSLDLEGLAQHRGSLYGAIGLRPHSQKHFENLLLQELIRLNNDEFIFIEGESRKIGDLHIPEFLYKAMKQGTNILITRSLEKRAEHAITEYFTSATDIEEIKKITLSLFKVISKEKKQEMVSFLDQGKLKEAVTILLEYYYDHLYNHTLKNIPFSCTVSNNNEQEAVRELNSFVSSSTAQNTITTPELLHSSEA